MPDTPLRSPECTGAPLSLEAGEDPRHDVLASRRVNLGQIVIQAHVPPHRVRDVHREWTRSLEHGAPPNSHALGDDPDLNMLANAAE